MRCSKNASEKKVHSNMGLPQKTRKFLNKRFNFTPKETRTKPKICRRKEITKMRAEIMKIEIKKQ